MMLGKMALEREATLTSEKLNLFVESFCEMLDTPGVVWADVVNGIEALGKRTRKEGEPGWFDLGTMRAEVKRQGTIRRCAEERAKREKCEREMREQYEAEVAAGENKPDPMMRMKLAALIGKSTMPGGEPGQPARAYTMPGQPAEPPAPPPRTLRDLSEPEVLALISALDAWQAISAENRDVAMRTMASVPTGDAAAADALRRVLRRHLPETTPEAPAAENEQKAV
jgi:hypothetical protein